MEKDVGEDASSNQGILFSRNLGQRLQDFLEEAGGQYE